MSREKENHESRRWLDQAKADIRAAVISLEGGAYEWACFQSQQAGEKVLKACWYHFGLDPWGHSLVKLLHDFPDEKRPFSIADIEDNAMLLDKMYIPTRYPNGLPDLIPSKVYSKNEAKAAIKAAEEILIAIEKFI